MAKSSENNWKQALIGPLPNDFLRLKTNEQGDENMRNNEMNAISYPTQYMTPRVASRLCITCVQAKLVRNYGITRMDPYVRIRVGHYCYETLTDTNGGKNPHWGRVIQCQLPIGINSIFLEIYDECSFKMDELIAWCEIKLPESVLRGETHEEWYPLSGRQGEGLEGAIDVVLSFSNHQQSCIYQAIPSVNPLPIIQHDRPIYITAPQNPPQQVLQAQKLSKIELQQIKEMFPNIEMNVVKTVFEANNGNKDATISSLLQLNE